MSSSRNPLIHASMAIQLPATLAVSLVGNLLVAWWTGTIWTDVAPFLILNLVLFAGLVVLTRWQESHTRSQLDIFSRIEYESPAVPARALIAMVSKGLGRETALAAARHHREHLRHLWLITTQSATEDAAYVAETVKAEMPQVEVHPTRPLFDLHTIKDVKDEVETARHKALRLNGIGELDLVCDFTGLKKHSSAGMVLACATRTSRLQFVPASTEDDRKRGTEPSTPIEVEVAYEVTAQPAPPPLG